MWRVDALGRLREKQLAGPILMAGGLGIVGAAGYGYTGLAGHLFDAADAGAILNLYFVVNIVGPGMFAALEQETNRATSGALAAGYSARAVTRKALRLGLGLLGVAVVVLLAGSPLLVNQVFHSNWWLEFAVIVGVGSALAGYLTRGVLGGRSQFHGYAGTLATEGLSRIVPVAVVAALGVASVAAYGVLYAIGLGCAGLVGWWCLRRSGEPTADEPLPGESADAMAGMRAGVVFLVGAMLLTQLVPNLAPLVVTSRLPGDAALAAAFGSACILVRAPLLLFSPVQALLLPRLTSAIVAGDHARFRRSVRLVVSAVLAIGLLGAVLSWAIGPWVVQLFFGTSVDLSGVLLGLLGLSTLFLMAAQVLQPALIAAQRHRIVTIGWSVGSAVLVGLLFLPIAPVTAAVLAQLVGSVLVAATMTVGMAGIGRRAPANPDGREQGAWQPS